MLRNQFFSLVCLSAVISLSCSHCPKDKNRISSASQVVEAFCNEDAEGAQAWSSHWQSKIQAYTTWEDSPGWDSVDVIKSYQILAVKENNNSAEVDVAYSILGAMDSAEVGFSFIPQLKEEKVKFILTKVSEKWKIASPQLKPHISTTAAFELLDRDCVNLNKIDDKTRNRHLAIKNQISSLLK